MPRIARIVLAALVALIVIIGIYSTVEGASLGAGHAGVGGRSLTGSTMSLEQHRSASPGLIPYQTDQNGRGHDCNSERQPVPED